jgi:hypothetical protein
LRTLQDWEREIAEVLKRARKAQQFNVAAEVSPVLDEARKAALQLGDEGPAYLLLIAEHLSDPQIVACHGEASREHMKQIGRIFAVASRGAGLLGS